MAKANRPCICTRALPVVFLPFKLRLTESHAGCLVREQRASCHCAASIDTARKDSHFFSLDWGMPRATPARGCRPQRAASVHCSAPRRNSTRSSGTGAQATPPPGPTTATRRRRPRSPRRAKGPSRRCSSSTPWPWCQRVGMVVGPGSGRCARRGSPGPNPRGREAGP